MKSCDTCPSRVSAGTDAVAFFGKRGDFGVAMCGRYGYVLEQPGRDEAINKRIATITASSCDEHGQDRPDNPPNMLQSVVGFPLTAVRPRQPGDHQPMACVGCEHFIDIAVVEKELGWRAPMCAAKAVLLHPTRLAQEASECAIGVTGANKTTTEGVVGIDPRFEGIATVRMGTRESFAGGPYDPAKFISIDPREYETDLPVTAEHAAAGIRAWRKVPDPKGEKPPIYMPIFNGEKLVGFDPRDTYGEHAPHLYLDHSGLLYTWAAYAMGGIDPSGRGLNKCLALVGPAGTGKTEFFAFVAWLMDLPLYVISCRPDMSPFELIGGNALVPNEDETGTITRFIPGRFLSNFDKPCVMVLDEFASLPDEGWFALRGVFVGAKSVTVEEHSITKHQGPLTFIGLATNPDYDPAYRGVRPLSPADKQRFPWKAVDLPDENTERKIILSHCDDLGYELPLDVLDKIIVIGQEIREVIKSEGLDASWGIRPNVAVAQASWVFSLEDAYRTTMLDALEPALADSLMTIVKSHTERGDF